MRRRECIARSALVLYPSQLYQFNSEEQFADNFVGKRIQPFWIEDEARKIPGTNFVVDHVFREFAVRDGRLITGQQQYSGAAAARLTIEALGR
jgi:putative intracellular protease/amidase